MPNITNKTLVMAIQVLAWELRSQRDALAEGGAEPEDYQFLEDLERATEDLEAAYDEAAKTVINLPPYDILVGKPGSSPAAE